jgi:hypothetical protein
MEDRLSQILLDCMHRSSDAVSASTLQSLNEGEWEQLLSMTAQQGQLSFFYHRLKSRGLETIIPENYVGILKAAYHENAARNLVIQSQLSSIISALRSEDIPCIILKGAHLSAVFYKNQALRKMSDIDLLVPVSLVGRAAEALSSLGYSTSDSYKYNVDWEKVDHHLPLTSKPLSMPVEIHWSIILPGLCPGIDNDHHAIWERSVKIRIGNVDTFGLCAEDLVLHLSFHACKHYFEHGLRPLIDLVHIISDGEDILWQELVARSHQWGVNRSLYLVLRLAKELTGAEVPFEVLSDLRPADFNELVLVQARELIFTDPHKTFSVIPNLTAWHDLPFHQKIAVFFRRIFLPRPNIAALYDVPPRSMKLYWYYLVRFKDLVLKHSGAAVRLCQPDQELTAIARRKIILNDYLAGT